MTNATLRTPTEVETEQDFPRLAEGTDVVQAQQMVEHTEAADHQNWYHASVQKLLTQNEGKDIESGNDYWLPHTD